MITTLAVPLKEELLVDNLDTVEVRAVSKIYEINLCRRSKYYDTVLREPMY